MGWLAGLASGKDVGRAERWVGVACTMGQVVGWATDRVVALCWVWAVCVAVHPILQLSTPAQRLDVSQASGL